MCHVLTLVQCCSCQRTTMQTHTTCWASWRKWTWSMSKWPPRPAPVKTKRQSQHRRRTFPNPHSFLTVIPTVIVTRYFEIHSVLFVNTVNFVNIPCSQHIIDLLCQNTPVISNQSPSLFEMFPLHPKIFIRRSLNFSELHSQCENNNDNELTGPV